MFSNSFILLNQTQKGISPDPKRASSESSRSEKHYELCNKDQHHCTLAVWQQSSHLIAQNRQLTYPLRNKQFTSVFLLLQFASYTNNDDEERVSFIFRYYTSGGAVYFYKVALQPAPCLPRSIISTGIQTQHNLTWVS